jgi:hypothetical protein
MLVDFLMNISKKEKILLQSMKKKNFHLSKLCNYSGILKLLHIYFQKAASIYMLLFDI